MHSNFIILATFVRLESVNGWYATTLSPPQMPTTVKKHGFTCPNNPSKICIQLYNPCLIAYRFHDGAVLFSKHLSDVPTPLFITLASISKGEMGIYDTLRWV